VLHRREDRAIPFRLGQELAAGIPGAAMVALDGVDHFPWIGGVDDVVGAALTAMGVGAARAAVAGGVEVDTDLSARELEVLRLVALGHSDREIAAQLVLSPHTVHRHVANIRTKLRLPSRAAAAAHAARLGLL
jgi:DNA-binding CsgD family transcriptional regulator